ncbi:SusC/RagA family TonB-linked outer membrane protein [Xanthocytophaga agilis]|uniref:SusC/RagA family TonB-linked outer membrane protein n=1 Tax=Xanthocytophaga agilis TaxID=3048010 RepID=A0AAE3R8I6_9BACT|nr:SusC/RagA family TonB-linked outer membrane protein [Xanthocytophaga agilis]MDJ1505709.1 SusC/RagA family TonB-linked outer membrane protein [Xanthocytophaga agilis]
MKKQLPDGLPSILLSTNARLLVLSILIFFVCSTRILAQNTPIRGKVLEGTSKEPLIGASVTVKGERIGTITDAKGEFSLSVPPNAILEISSIGYVTQSVTVGNQTMLTITLAEDLTNLGEVVVTALGIKKEQKKLGYATSTVSAEQISENRSPNFINTLSGKIAGVNISSLGTGPGGTAKVRIRGQSSIGGQNGPLIVVNGVPINNTNFGSNQGNSGADNSIASRIATNTSDGGDGLSSINPDDIETMTVLKGATAAALYGSRAKDGVIMITTKSKGEKKGIGLSYNLNYTNDTPLDFTDYQYEYGQGENGVRPTTANPTSGQWSFGEKFAPGMTQVLFNNITVPYVPVRNRIRDFYRNGQNISHTVALSSNGEKGGLNLSIANIDNKGIVPNHSFNRKIINLGFSYNLTPKLSFAGNINYSNEKTRNAPNISQQDLTIPTSLMNLANSMPLDLLEANKFNADGNETVYSRFTNRTNPYFTLSERFQNVIRDRIFGNVSVKYNILSWLSVQARVGQDYWSRDQDYNTPTGTAFLSPAPAGFVNGNYVQETRRFREINKDILISASKTFGKFGIDLNVGGNQLYVRQDYNSVYVQDFVVRGLYTVMNSRQKEPLYVLTERAVNSLYGSGEFSFKNFLFLNVTARNDWFSTLSPANRSILYPSVSLSYVLSDSFDGLPQWVNFVKLRAAYAQVGSDTDVPAYSNNLFYNINPALFANPSGSMQPVGTISGNTVPNPNLKPMRVDEKEAGFEVKLFNNRVNIDFAIYKKVTTDQIVTAQVSDASGYINTLVNSGQSQNVGQEMLVNLVPVQSSTFKWDITFNASHNKTKVLSLLTDKPGERITVGTGFFGGELRQVVGQEMGQIYSFGFRRDEQGRQVFGSSGLPLRTTDLISFGSALPEWVGGITNSFNYKGIALSFLIDFKLGNTIISNTNMNAYRHGLHKATLVGRDGGVVGVGVNEKGETNTAKANAQDYYSILRTQSILEWVVYNGGFWKLRQLTVGYDFSKFLPKNSPISGVKLSFVANNVLMLKKWIDNIDPESFGNSSDNLSGIEMTGLPTTRSLGFNLNVKF